MRAFTSLARAGPGAIIRNLVLFRLCPIRNIFSSIKGGWQANNSPRLYLYSSVFSSDSENALWGDSFFTFFGVLAPELLSRQDKSLHKKLYSPCVSWRKCILYEKNMDPLFVPCLCLHRECGVITMLPALKEQWEEHTRFFALLLSSVLYNQGVNHNLNRKQATVSLGISLGI